MTFTWKPIIVEGVAHSGTRVLVQILSTLGSEGGDFDNPWKENKFFLQIHKSLIFKISNKGWTETIYDLSYVKKLEDDLRFKDEILELLRTQLQIHYPRCAISPWHWKCPTSALFERTWVEIFPEAYYIHIVRNPLECAQSFLRRNQFRSIKEGLEFCEVMDRKITQVSKQNYLRVKYENLASEIERIQDFVHLSCSRDKLDFAKCLIKRDDRCWYKDRTLKQNLLNLRAKFLGFIEQVSPR